MKQPQENKTNPTSVSFEDTAVAFQNKTDKERMSIAFNIILRGRYEAESSLQSVEI